MTRVTKVDLGFALRPSEPKQIYGWLLEDILEEKALTTLKRMFEIKFSDSDLKWDRQSFTFNNRAFGAARQRRSGDQRYVKIVDLAELRDYYFQTPDTVYQWGIQTLRESVHPIFYHTIEKLLSLEPFSLEPGKWLPQRAHINNMHWDETMEIHLDNVPELYKVDYYDSRQLSCTIYLDEITKGGELWADTEPGFVYKPRANTAMVFNGIQFYHGINCNQDEFKRVRKAFTVRFNHIDDLDLPGHPDLCLYKPQFPDQFQA